MSPSRTLGYRHPEHSGLATLVPRPSESASGLAHGRTTVPLHRPPIPPYLTPIITPPTHLSHCNPPWSNINSPLQAALAIRLEPARALERKPSPTPEKGLATRSLRPSARGGHPSSRDTPATSASPASRVVTSCSATTGIGGLGALSVWWIKLGIVPERIEPGKPQQNGRHERMHRTLKDDVANKPEANRQAQQLAFDRFRHEYNDVRPHEALVQQTPSSRYTTSRRVMPAALTSPEYPSTMEVRRVQPAGDISWQGHVVHVTKLLSGEPVGLEQLEEQRWRMHYGPVALAEVTMRGKELRLDKQR